MNMTSVPNERWRYALTHASCTISFSYSGVRVSYLLESA